LKNADIEEGGLWELGLLAQRARAQLAVDVENRDYVPTHSGMDRFMEVSPGKID
jgi:hypothetical protein